MARSVCISGQLYLLELAMHLMKDIPELRIVELNTDGVMAEFDDSQYEAVNAIIQEWQERTGFGLEEEAVDQYYAKDVNNYAEVIDGKVKTKGGYLVRGIAPAGAFNINNNAVIVAEAIREYFVNGTAPEDTINACMDPFKFQLIAKAGAKYREAYHMVDGEKQPVQKVNRVYATTDERYGKLYKVKTETDAEAKIEMLPEHCIIDNSAVTDPDHTTIDQIDKQFYIAMAKKRINDFLGIEEKKERKQRMPRTASAQEPQTPMNVHQKLIEARVRFLQNGTKKNGMNSDLRYMYFELEDIVPAATQIFKDLGLIPIVRMDSATNCAYMDIVNADETNQVITFCLPLVLWQGNKGTTPVQAAGATFTYYRRYLYMVALDIIEADEIDSKPQNALAPQEAPQAPKVPATPEKREEVKKELTNAEGNADTLQLTQLKKALKTLKDKYAEDEAHRDYVVNWISTLAQKTNGFTQISKAACAKVLEAAGSMIEGNFPEVTND